jgi:hypothetical protein
MNNARLIQLLSAQSRPPVVLTSWFSNGEKGGIWLASLSKYLFQDTGKTIPAVVGGTVAKAVCPATGVELTFSNVTLQVDSAGKRYFALDGTTNSGQTSSIDFTGTDKMTVVAGLRKSSDAAIGVAVELSPTIGANNGAFALYAPDSSATSVYAALSKGTTLATATTAANYAAPNLAVISASLDIAGHSIALRVNGASAATSTATQGTGNYGNYVLNVTARGGSSARFKDRLYGIVVCGATRTAGQITDAEAYMNKVTGAF